MTPRILLIGKDGQLGSELANLLQESFSQTSKFIALGRRELELSRPADLRRAIDEARPSLIVNAAAYTAVDKAETEESLAQAINTDAPAVIAEEAQKIGALLVHYSTDYVFDGTKRTPYVEADPTNPLSAYGRTKLAGEEAVRASGASHLIFRTAWVYATSGKNFLLTVLRLAAERGELRIVNDQFGAPTWSREIAAATVRVLQDAAASSGGDGIAAIAERSGTYHITAAGETTWYQFALSILDECSRLSPTTSWFAAATGNRPLIAKRIVPITTHDYPTPARRPAYSVLSNHRFARTFGFSLPDWRTQLSRAVNPRDGRS